MPQPTDKQLYAEVKQEIYAKYSNIVHTEAGCWFGNRNAGGGTYKGPPNKHEGLNLWFAEDWRNQRGGGRLQIQKRCVPTNGEGQ